MSTAQHTPGPWTYSRGTDYGDTRFYIAQAEGAPYTPYYSDVATLIAETVSDERKSIQEANARLIAAAPDGLDAAQEALIALAEAPHSMAVRLASQKLRAFIAKATGAQS